MSLPLIVIGAGAHGRVLADTLRVCGRKVLGFLDARPDLQGAQVDGLPILGGDEHLECHDPQAVMLANGIGSAGSTEARRRVYERIKAAGFQLETVRHPATTMSDSVVLKVGAQVMAGAVLQTGVVVGENTLVDIGVLLDHDCVIGAHCHLAPGVVFSGTVRMGDGCHVGTGAKFIQGLTIGAGALIAAGAVVVRDVPEGARMAGVPARPMEKR